MGKDKCVAIIPARGGSRGIPRKNLIPIAGKPLIAWTIEVALASSMVDHVLVCSEDQEVLKVARNYGVEDFQQPKRLAADHTRMTEVVENVLRSGELADQFEYLVLLQPTSPLRIEGDVDEAIMLTYQRACDSCVSVSPVQKSPHWTFQIDLAGCLVPLLKNTIMETIRQNLPEYFALNGAIYVARIAWFLQNERFVAPESVAYVMPKERSIDVDDRIDFLICEALLKLRS